MRRRVLVPLSVALASSVIGGSAARLASADEPPACDQRAPTFRPPIRLGSGFGYEPGIETDSRGTIFLMAHKLSLAAEGSGTGTRTASWLWRSTDDGRTFQDMSGLMGATDKAFAFEGDGAVDEKDRFYYVDTWVADNHFSRYVDRGATLDIWRPGVVSLEMVDDRPWIAAHHDGYVYYMSNSVNPVTGRLVVHRSTDAGLTFDPVGVSFPNSLWGFLDADPNSDHVYAFMNQTSNDDLVVWISANRGQTWTKRVVATYEVGENSFGFPAVAVSPVDGSVYTIWGDGSNKLKMARSTNRGQSWTVHDVTPFSGRYAHPWINVGPTGDVGILFEADPTGVSGSGSYVYGMIWRPGSDCLLQPGNLGSLCTGPARTYARLDTKSVAYGSQADFIQNEFTPDNAFNAPYEASGSLIKYTKQTSGPNMDGTPFCGLVGTP